MHFLLLASFILFSSASPCPLLEAIKGNRLKRQKFGTTVAPKPLFIVKRLGRPPTLLQNPDFKTDDSLKALAQQVSMAMGQQLGLEPNGNFAIATQDIGKDLKQYLGPEILAKPFQLGADQLPSTFSLPPFPENGRQQQQFNSQMGDGTQSLMNGQQQLEITKNLPFM
uniref:Zasp-like motif domain-containing protein n=1 Tax=Syphacia muris TaxID=451379 RepID=A0A0N5AJ15_9BILA